MNPHALPASDPAPVPGGDVVQLPTAAARKVRQPPAAHYYRAKQAALAAGAVVPSPAHWQYPADRKREAEEATARTERDAIYSAGGLERGPTLLIITAMLHAMDRAEARKVLERLRFYQAVAANEPSPSLTAAATWLAALIGEPPR